MHLSEQILRILDEALGLQGKAQSFDRDTALLGALPELDSMAVLALITGLENHFGITFDDDDLMTNERVYTAAPTAQQIAGLVTTDGKPAPTQME